MSPAWSIASLAQGSVQVDTSRSLITIDLLKKYCDASVQQVNVDRSSIYFSKGIADSLRTEIKNTLVVQNESLSEKYLGLPTDVGKSKEGCFRYLKDRV